MEKIEMQFTAGYSLDILRRVTVTLTLDRKGKRYSIGYGLPDLETEEGQAEAQAEEAVLPESILAAFTEEAVAEILSRNEIPNEAGFHILDGNTYDIIIRRGRRKREYYADEASIRTYPLLRKLANWCIRQLEHADFSQFSRSISIQNPLEQKDTTDFLELQDAAWQKIEDDMSKHPLTREQVKAQARELKMLSDAAKQR